MHYRKKRFRKSALEGIFALVLVAIIAGIAGGGLVGLATDHKLSSSSSSGTGLGGQ